MHLFTLYRGRKKSKLKPVMTDSQRKCENYQKALKASDIKSHFYDVQPADADASIWRKNTSTKWTNYNDDRPKKV